MINPLDYPIFLSPPLRTVKPHWWLQHVPFAMFLVDLARPKLLVELGTHTGTSYNAFCQAVKELSLDTKCYAIDNWKGDPHEGYYGDEILENLKAFHDPIYGEFSRLIQTTFDDAVHYFDDKSIDLLHIDGYHTYDAVKHDFETWLPKISHRGTVLLHDISVCQGDFGVWKYWSELKEQYPTFEFIHGMGLGIVFVGTEPVGDIGKLFSMSVDEITRFQNFFFNFGLKVSTIVEKEEQLQVAYEGEQAPQVIGKEQIVQSLTALIAEKEQIVQSLTALVAEKEQIVQSLTALVAEKEQLVAEKEQIVAEKVQIVRSLEAQIAEEEHAINILNMQVAKREHDLAEIRSSKAWKLALLFRRIWLVLAPANSWRDTLLRQLVKVLISPLKKIRRNRRLMEEVALVRLSDLFDEAWYLVKNPDVAKAKTDPIRHYLLFGGFERRDPSPHFDSGWYLDTYKDVKIAGINPLVHYLEAGRKEGRAILPVQEFLQSAEFQVPSGIIDMAQNSKTNEIAVVLHLFYEDLFEEIKEYLKNLGRFDLYISIPKSNPEFEDKIFASFPDSRIFYAENRGRDILPFISIYRSISSLNYKYLLKIHTKKTPHRKDGETWRTDIYRKLMGSHEIINSVISAFENDPKIGIIGPKGHVIDYETYQGGNKEKTEELARRVRINKEKFSFDFVAGSMFWARPEALGYLALLPIRFQEFEPEPLEPDGALVHAVERFIGLIVKETGYLIHEVDDQGKIYDSGHNSLTHEYPFGMPNYSRVGGKGKIARIQNSVKNRFRSLAGLLRKGWSLGRLIYDKREKIFRILIDIIKNPRDPGTTQIILKSVRLIKGEPEPLISSQYEITDTTPAILYEQIELTEQLAQKLLKCLVNDEYVLSISHTDYTQVVGGVEIRVMDEQKVYNKNRIDYLQIYPLLKSRSGWVSDKDPLYIGINCNGERLGITDRVGLLFALKQLNGKKLSNVIIHHTMGFDIALIHLILDEVGDKTGQFWLHDNFSLCPGYTLLRNDLVYCGVPDINSNACLICKYGGARRIQQPAYRKLFEANNLDVLAPSKFTLDLWKEKFPIPTNSGRVVPHLTLNWNGIEPVKHSNMPLRIGYLGYPVFWKGWDTWLRLVKNFRNDIRYQFYCFTSWSSTPGGMKRVSVSVTKDDRLSMVKALRNNNIDVAFLWSLCPETFSFTLYESLAAGCYVLTYKDSGNIQAYLNENISRGLVLNDETSLFELFSGNDLYSLVANYQKNGRPLGELSFLPEFE